MSSIKIENLCASVGGAEILKGINLEINDGEIHAIMGPNGSGKSTLSSIIAGHPDYEVTNGRILLDGKNIMELAPEERAHRGIFLAFQYPVEIPGVSNANFMKQSVNDVRKARGEEPLDAGAFLKLMREKAKLVEMDNSFMKRSVNDGFSGGEKKRNEVFQMAMLDPEFVIMDETDSGLDIDALRIVANGVNKIKDGKKSFLIITHYQRLLEYIVPDFVHVLSDGKIVKSGGSELALELEEKGYDWIKEVSVGSKGELV
jgi:Fe-S cluster assembly ATP-binding protein